VRVRVRVRVGVLHVCALVVMVVEVEMGDLGGGYHNLYSQRHGPSSPCHP
jgi:hypothetical protein